MHRVAEEVREFIAERFLFGDSSAMPAGGESFLEKGIIDSTGVMELIAFVERQYGFKVADEEILPENLDSIDRVTAFVARKRGGVPELAESRARPAA